MSIPAPAPTPPAPAVKEGSAYVQCDGDPNNMSDGEAAARLVGAVTLLALFAKPPEAADASKRKFGEAGVTACTGLIEGAAREGSPARRMPLILARALHRIEARQYEAAIADLKVARDEAQAAGFMNDPFYVRSQARSFDEIEAAALLRLGRFGDARDASLRSAAAQPRTLVPLLTIPGFNEFVREPSPGEIEYLMRIARADASLGSYAARRMEELGLFAQAAELREAVLDFDVSGTPDLKSSQLIAETAVINMLAGNTERAVKLAAEARANFDKRVADGKPESSAAAFVEVMDLYTVLETARTDIKAARRLFAARSQWVSASFGAVVEANRRLRAGATADELIGGLAGDPDAMWKKRADARMAQMLEQDKNNRALFGLIETPVRASVTQPVAKTVWRLDKDRMVLKLKADPKRTSKLEFMSLYGQSINTATQAYMMHAALLARARGHQGFVISIILRENLVFAQFMTGSSGSPGMAAAIFNDAAPVIAELTPIFPDPSIKPAK